MNNVKIVGQMGLIYNIKQSFSKCKFPRFTIIVGDSGSGRKTISEKLANSIRATLITIETDAESIKNITKLVTSYHTPTMVLIPDADNLSSVAKNVLLKVTEEPPKDIYFVMTLKDKSNTLETLLSRATVLYMNKYSKNELKEYINQKRIVFDEEQIEIVLKTCRTPGDINLIAGYDIYYMWEYAKQVAENIGNVSIINAMNITKKLDVFIENGWNVSIFFRMLENHWLFLLKEDKSNKMNYLNYILVLGKYKQMLKTKSVDRKSTIDNLIIALHDIKT
jgi:hypothetical protein